MHKNLAYALILGLTGFLIAPLPVHADPFPQLPAATQVDDGDLASVRGRYIFSAGSHDAASAILRSAGPVAQSSAPAAMPQSHQISPLASVPAAQPGARVAYFGISMVSSWTVGTGTSAAGVSVGANIGVDPNSHSVSTGTWSASLNGGLPSAPGGNSVNGTSPLTNVSGGIGQNIQVAGNGNTVNNIATINIGASVPGQTSVPVSNTCGTACKTSIDANGISISIAAAQGIVSQNVGGNGVMQNVQLSSDLNTVTNQLAMQVRTTPAGALDPNGINFILQSLNVIR